MSDNSASKVDLSASIVTYKNSKEILLQAISSFLNTRLAVKLYIVDNSPTDELKSLIADKRVEYIFNYRNVGFGAGHNLAIRKSEGTSLFHLVLNPDIYFKEGTLESLYLFMLKNPEVGLAMPKILYPDGSTQFVCKLLPTPYDMILRRFFKFDKRQLEENNHRYEMRFSGYDKVMDVPYLSGCFMFLRRSALAKAGLFDERIFLYTEDADLSRRIHQHYRTVLFPEAEVFHYFGKASHKSVKMLLYAIHGTMVYFNKWGWFNDKERERINENIISQFTK